VWLWLGLAYMGVSISMFVLGRLSPAEWDNPYPCIEEPTELENQFSFANCLWFSIGALLQQGSELAPKYMILLILISHNHIHCIFFTELTQLGLWPLPGGSSL